MRTNRRGFLKGLGGLAAASALGGCRCPFCACSRPSCAAQLYSIHKIFWTKPEWCLAGLKAAGYDGVEFAGYEKRIVTEAKELKAFENPELPFYLVQIAPFDYWLKPTDPGVSACDIWDIFA